MGGADRRDHAGDILDHQLMHDQRRQVIEQMCVIDEQ
jgi:hypothetical protein